jgi:hypothetical protein
VKSEVDQLLEDLENIRSNAGTAGSDHPKVKKWVAEVRSHLAREGHKKDRKKFEQLQIVKGGSEMWGQHTVDPSSVKKLKAELDVIEAILEKMTGTSEEPGESSADQKMRELFLTPDEESAEEAVQEEAREETQEETLDESEVECHVDNLIEKRLVETKDEGHQQGQIEIENVKNITDLEKTMDQKIEPNFEAVSKQHLSPSTREKAVDKLMDDLKTQMKSSEPDWEKIQGVMSDMMGLKKTGELLERLNATTNTPGVPWEIVRDSMAQLWSIKKEIIIDLLPTLLKT